MNARHPPKTDSIDELARFWDEHDLTDYEDELEEVSEPVFVRGKEAMLQIRLPKQELEHIKRLANKKGIDSAALIQEWVLEKLRAA
jgi:predicted DNA binding CopG/RHH family protein